MNTRYTNLDTLPIPKRPKNIPATSQWLAGEGAGSWFYISTYKDQKYIIKRYSDKGILECEGLFKINDRKYFLENAPFIISYPSHCAIVTVIQENQIIQFVTT